MTQPGALSNLVPAGDDYFVRRLTDLQRQIDEMRTARTLLDIATSAIQPGLIQANATNFGMSTGMSVKVSESVAMPAGFRACVLSVVGTVFIINDTGSADMLEAAVGIAGQTSTVAVSEVQPSAYSQVTAGYALVVYADDAAQSFFTARGWPAGHSISGAGSFTVDARAKVVYGGGYYLGYDPPNQATLSGTALFVR